MHDINIGKVTEQMYLFLIREEASAKDIKLLHENLEEKENKVPSLC